MTATKKKGLTLFVELGQDQAKYLCANESRDRTRPNQLQVTAFGEVESGSPLEEITKQLAAQKQKPRSLVLLLTRAEFEVHLFQLPEVDPDDVSQVVNNLVAESADSLDFTTDFILNSRGDSAGQNALTWTLSNAVIDSLRTQAKQSGMNLAAITSRAIGSIALWRNLVQTRSPHAVIATIASGSIDFAVIYNHEVTHIRSIPFPSSDLDQITSRLLSELQRTVAVTGDADESESTRVYLFGAAEDRKPIAERLTEEFEVPVSILNPVDNTVFKQQHLGVSESEEYCHLIGAAKAHFFDHLDVDLISPKKPEQKTLPWRRIATWAAVVLALAGLGTFVVWDDALSQLEEIAEKRDEFDQLAPEARRVLEMKDELAAIRAWRNSEVVWLDQLDQLSSRLPPREQSLIRRISMTAGDNGKSRIDLSVEVSDNELVAGLEQAIRDEDNQVVSKRVSESAGRGGESWNFETSIQFLASPPKLKFLKDDPASEPSSFKDSPEPENTQSSQTNPAAPTSGEPGLESSDKQTSDKQTSDKQTSETKTAGVKTIDTDSAKEPERQEADQ